jgi:hypothetical protein
MLRCRRSTAKGMVMNLFLIVGCCLVSESAARAAAPPEVAGAILPGDNPSELLAKLDGQLERDVTEAKRLERSLDSLLDNGGSTEPQSSPDSPSGSLPSGSTPSSSTSGGGGPSNTNPSANQSNSSQSNKNHRYGHMWRGMRLAHLMRELAREERWLHHEERVLHHEERSLERRLARLRELEHHLQHLHHADMIGKKAGPAQWKPHAEDKNHLTKSDTNKKGTEAGTHLLAKGTVQPHPGHVAGTHTSHSHAAGSAGSQGQHPTNVAHHPSGTSHTPAAHGAGSNRTPTHHQTASHSAGQSSGHSAGPSSGHSSGSHH